MRAVSMHSRRKCAFVIIFFPRPVPIHPRGWGCLKCVLLRANHRWSEMVMVGCCNGSPSAGPRRDKPRWCRFLRCAQMLMANNDISNINNNNNSNNHHNDKPFRPPLAECVLLESDCNARDAATASAAVCVCVCVYEMVIIIWKIMEKSLPLAKAACFARKVDSVPAFPQPAQPTNYRQWVQWRS